MTVRAIRPVSASGPIGHELVGAGPRHVIILNDWLCDTSTWSEAKRFLDEDNFTFAFADLRGYGRSIERTGAFSLVEAVADVLSLSEFLSWSRFCVVGHSMSALVVLHLAQQHSNRVERAVLLTPPPPGGFGADDATLSGLRALALADDETRAEQLAPRFGDRLSPGWMTYKLMRWRATADSYAVAGYSAMFAREGLPDLRTRIAIPVLAITGEQDAPPMRQEAVARDLKPLCEQLTVTSLADSGHYPMQEMPPLTVALVQRFLIGSSP